MVQPSGADCKSILVVLSAEQFYVYHTEGDSERRPDSSGRCSLSWNKYPDLGKACLDHFPGRVCRGMLQLIYFNMQF